jgi:hypothetical protein
MVSPTCSLTLVIEDNTAIDIRAFSVTLVFDSFNKAVLARIPEISGVLKSFTCSLAKEELRA